MATELTLRRLAKLVNKIDSLLVEQTGEALNNLTVNAFIHDTDADIVSQLNAAAERHHGAFLAAHLLNELRITLRNLVAVENHKAGITEIVGRLRGLENEVTLLSNIRRKAGKDGRLEEAKLSTRLDALRRRGEKTQIEMYGRSSDDSYVTLQALYNKTIDDLEAEEKSLRMQIDLLQDRLERINTSVAVEIPAGAEELLRSFDLLPPAGTP